MPFRDKTNRLIVEIQNLRASGASDSILAEIVAKAVHSGPEAIDKNGVPYIEHPRRVSSIVSALFHEHSQLEANAYSAAWLHDVIEDSQTHFGEAVTKDDLSLMGFNGKVVDAVHLLSKDADYIEEEYLDRIANDEVAKLVKFADLTDNTSPLRSSGLNQDRRTRYQRYWNRLVFNRVK
jgi:(p)ppGpp synthase/HD superfamily hydrolase